MRRILPCLILLAAGAAAADTDLATFEARFHDETLRVDYFHTGNADEEIVSLDQMWRQGTWAGSRTRLVDDLDLGRYYAKAYDRESGELVWSRGFDSYFGEWKTTARAGTGERRTYHESALLPMPKMPIVFTLEVRGDDNGLREIFRREIEPDDWHIRRDALPGGVRVFETAVSGDPHQRVDIAIVGDGYTPLETDKFAADCRRFADTMLNHEPYASRRDQFNVWGVLRSSLESGCDEPSRGVHRNTALGSTFDSLDSERYLLTEDNRAIRDIAAHAPYDVLYIMVNHERYGGGGIYNLFCTFTSDNQWSEYVFLHEFGHSFAGLADEYYTSSTGYDEFYKPGREPNERNITALRDPAHLKWGDLATPGVALPTPWDQDDYDKADVAYQTERGAINDEIARLMTSGAPAAEVEAAKARGEELSLRHQLEVDAWFAANPAHGKVGAFQGAGYMARGMYRAELDCIMFTKGIKPFCAACERGIREVIERYRE
ncbi:peptidase M64 [bacterium]|nr:peptidase M64 [bacterium]